MLPPSPMGSGEGHCWPRMRRAGAAAALVFLCASPISPSHSASLGDAHGQQKGFKFTQAPGSPLDCIRRGATKAQEAGHCSIVRLRGGRPHSELDGEAAWWDIEAFDAATADESAEVSKEADAHAGSLDDVEAPLLVGKVPQFGARGPKVFLPASLWRQDVGERYKLLVPPRHSAKQRKGAATGATRKSVSAAQMLDAVAKVSLSAPPLPGKCIDQVVMFVDLDKAAIFGNDGNDFGIALQWMEKPFSDVVKLYSLLLNPNLKETYKALAAHAHRVKVVIYTMRASYLVYQSCFRDNNPMLALRWHPSWHIDGQLYLPSHLVTSQQIMEKTEWAAELMESECLDVKKSLERLLAVRDVIKNELSLDELPQVVVTAQLKSVSRTAKVLGLKEDASYLWDDSPLLAPVPQVVRVAPFIAMLPAQREKLLSFLYRELPPEALEEDLVDFLLSASAAEAAVVRESSGKLAYHVPCAAELEPWSLPRSGLWSQVVWQHLPRTRSRDFEHESAARRAPSTTSAAAARVPGAMPAASSDAAEVKEPAKGVCVGGVVAGATLTLKEVGNTDKGAGTDAGSWSPVTPLDDEIEWPRGSVSLTPTMGRGGVKLVRQSSRKSNSAPILPSSWARHEVALREGRGGWKLGAEDRN